MKPSRFAELREQKGLTQQQLADALDMSVRAMSAWETGGRKPPIDKLEWLADFYGVSTDYLLGRTDSPLFEHKQTDNSVILSTKKEPPAQTGEETSIPLEIKITDDMPKDRKQLEQFVLEMIRKSLDGHEPDQ